MCDDGGMWEGGCEKNQKKKKKPENGKPKKNFGKEDFPVAVTEMIGDGKSDA
jgi:hypothetical protein